MYNPFISTFPCAEPFATNILTHSAYLMYRCYHLRSEISKRRLNCLLSCYTAYAAITLALLFFVTIAYDWITGNGKYTISASGHCYIVDCPSYNTLMISTSVAGINKFLQMIVFSAYLVYFYKFNRNTQATQTSVAHSRILFKIVIAMGATVGITFFILLLFCSFQNILISLTSSLVFCSSSNKLSLLLA